MKQTNKKRRLFEDDEVFGVKGKALGLSAVPKDAAKAAIGAGKKDGDDKDDVAVIKSGASFSAGELKPSQKEVIPKKATEFAFSAIMKIKPMESGPGGDLGAIVSADNFIMDGHHRWAATILVDPGAKLKGTQIMLPGQALVSALNVYTAGIGKSGNPGEGDISKFGGKAIEDEIDAILANGYWAEGDAEKCKEAFIKWGGGTVEDAKAKMVANADKMVKTLPAWAPSRVDMPVIDQPIVDKVADTIAKGELDFKPPYSDDVKSKMESVVRNMKKFHSVMGGGRKISNKTVKMLEDFNRKNKKALQESYLKKVKKQRLQEKLSDLLRPLVEQSLKGILKNKLK